jgi:hypothetical protein
VIDDSDRSRVARALESLEDAITLLEWRYPYEAESSIARLEEIREELRIALVLEGSSPTLLH